MSIYDAWKGIAVTFLSFDTSVFVFLGFFFIPFSTLIFFSPSWGVVSALGLFFNLFFFFFVQRIPCTVKRHLSVAS